MAGLADAGLADEHRVVLGAAREDLDDALDLLRAADDRVELARARGAVRSMPSWSTVGVRVCWRAPRAPAGARLGHALREDARDFGAHLLEVHAEALEDARGDALALADEAEEQVLGADVVVVQAARLVDRQLDDLLGARREADLAEDRAVAAADDELDGRADLVQLDAEVGEDLGGYAVALADEAEEEVLGADVVVVDYRSTRS